MRSTNALNDTIPQTIQLVVKVLDVSPKTSYCWKSNKTDLLSFCYNFNSVKNGIYTILECVSLVLMLDCEQIALQIYTHGSQSHMALFYCPCSDKLPIPTLLRL